MRLKRRLGVGSGEDYCNERVLPIAQIQCHPLEGCKHDQCQRLISTYAGFYEQYCRTSEDDPEASRNKLTLHAISLRDYSSPFDYEKQMNGRNSFFGRNIKRAKKKGYWVSTFSAQQKILEMNEVASSLKIRSFGPVFQKTHRKKNLFKERSLMAEAEEVGVDPIPCPIHWELLFGVFMGPISSTEKSRLVAYARLHRVGNIVSYDELIGHGQHLSDGVMKLLHLHIVQWLLGGADPSTKGVEYLVHGTVERGNSGFFFWKKKALFVPHLVQLVDFELPADFNEVQYLKLNPDVRASHIPPGTHYKIHGKLEGRLYK